MAAQIEEMRGESSGRFDQFSNLGLSYLRRPGPGETLVLLHGIGSNAHSFAPLINYLPTDWDVLAWNAPGYLASAPLDTAWPLAKDYADALAHFLDTTTAGPVHLLGHSLGTPIAAAFAARHPEKVKHLVLAASAQGYGAAPDSDLPAPAAARLQDLAKLGPEAFAKSRAARLVFEPKSHPENVARVEREMARIKQPGYGQAVRMLASGNLAGTMAKVSLQPEFIIGSADHITPMAQTQAVMAAWAQAHGAMPKLTEIPDAGHAVYLEQPAEFARALITDQVPQDAGEIE